MTAGPEPAAGAFSRFAAALPPPALLVISVISIQLGAAVAIDLFPVLGPIGTAFLRLALSAVLVVLASRGAITRAGIRGHAGTLLIYGAVLAVMNLTFYASIERIPLGIAVAIEFLGPLGLAVAGSRRAIHFAWAGLAALGIALLTPEIGDTLDPLGVALAAVAGVCWAAFTVLSKRMGRALPGNAGLAIGLVIAAVIALPVQLAIGRVGALDPGVVVAVVAVAVLSTTMPLLLEFEALKRMTARAYGVLVTLEPAAAAAIGAILLGQSMDVQGVLAIVCVMVAALGVTVSDRRGADGSL